MPGELVDTFGRVHRDLRISVTDRCNFRCTYCMPKEVFGAGYKFLPRDEVLSFEEITHLARILAEALDYARQAQAAAIALRAPVAQPSTRPVTDVIGVTPNAPPGPK